MLPFEILEYIVDFLHDDRGALSAVSLVSSTCLHASRFHLFYRLKFLRSPSSEYHQPIEAVIKTYQEIDQFLGRTPDLASNVRHLVFHRAETAHPAWSAVEPVIISIVQTLSRVKKISFWNTGWDHLSASLRGVLGQIMSQPAFECVEFQLCTFQSRRDMLDMLQLAPGLRRLELGRVEFVNESIQEVDVPEEGTPRRACSQPIRVDVLHIDYKPMLPIMQILKRDPSTVSFEFLRHLSISRHGDFGAAARLLARVGSSLVSLDICAAGSYSSGLLIADAIDIGLTPNLQVLRFREVRARFPDPVPRIISHFRGVKGPHGLKEIYIDISLSYSDLIEVTPWSWFAELFEEVRFPYLRKVAFSVSQGGTHECNYLNNACAALRDRGILWINGEQVDYPPVDYTSDDESLGKQSNDHESEDIHDNSQLDERTDSMGPENVELVPSFVEFSSILG
ncbi:hypothetical protein BDN72DRAFT_961840 [Pluteus cervinus]|uniref:Uncharacterized protein n=1 Tax=Pluteus cervinus TaxID=181527 RepID=A0ACD3ALH7_9AGAR|nr:hypothetical protein BDN72DRAFT_961840 [Pluteus cervinus]